MWSSRGGTVNLRPGGFEVGNFSAALHQELLFDYKPEIAEKLAGEFDLRMEKGKFSYES